MLLSLRKGQRPIENLRQYFLSTVTPMPSWSAASLMGRWYTFCSSGLLMRRASPPLWGRMMCSSPSIISSKSPLPPVPPPSSSPSSEAAAATDLALPALVPPRAPAAADGDGAASAAAAPVSPVVRPRRLPAPPRRVPPGVPGPPAPPALWPTLMGARPPCTIGIIGITPWGTMPGGTCICMWPPWGEARWPLPLCSSMRCMSLVIPPESKPCRLPWPNWPE
mmetsp:Transcript_19193/g.48802  ORF Transcript_19193/g.48802 Transcript_19193/m.48802 type:complete len:222 (+) Transcript_19193:1372-2037(+)